jgi:hypothetical protein
MLASDQVLHLHLPVSHLCPSVGRILRSASGGKVAANERL